MSVSGNDSYNKIRAFGTSSAFVPGSIHSSKSTDQQLGPLSSVSFTVDLTGKVANTVTNLGQIPAGCQFVSAFVKGSSLTSAGAPTFDVGFAVNATTAADDVLSAGTLAAVNAGATGLSTFAAPDPTVLTNVFLNVRNNVADVTTGFVTVTALLLCPFA